MQNKVKEFMDVSGQNTMRGEFDQKQTALYIGLVLEEVAELMRAQNMSFVADDLEIMANQWKRGGIAAYHNADTLDAFVDIAWVALGGAWAMGADADGAVNAVYENNMSKFPMIEGKRVVLRDENGKIRKPEGFVPVELGAYL